MARMTAVSDPLRPLPDGAYPGFGFQRITMASDWSAAGSNVVGVALSPSPIAVGSGHPTKPEGRANGTMETTYVVIPGLEGFKISFQRWFNTAYRTEWNSLDRFISAAVANGNAAFLLKSACWIFDAIPRRCRLNQHTSKSPSSSC
jgi:hypothetical protein